MPVVPLQCPHCAGPLQVDAANAGQQVLCPHCQGPLVVPPVEVLSQLLAMASGPPPPAPPAIGEAITLACPVCNGPFQVLPEMSGQQLGCPHCGSAITVPPIVPQYIPDSSPTNGFASAAETAVAPILPPGVSAEIPAVDDETLRLSPTYPPIAPPASDRYPPGMRPPTSESRQVNRERERPDTVAGSIADDRYPPGHQALKAGDVSDRKQPSGESTRPGSNDRFPPGMKLSGELQSKREPVAPDLPRSSPPRPASREITDRLPPARQPIDDLLPPGAAHPPESVKTEPVTSAKLPADRFESASMVDALLPPGNSGVALAPVSRPADAIPAAIDALLPPGASDASTLSAPSSGEPAQQPSLLDALLPPGAGGGDIPATGTQVAIPHAPRKLPQIPSNLPAGAVAVPTSDGGFVTVRETPKTIGHGEEAIEVRRLTPEEKARRRLRNNLIVGGFCLLVIVVVVIILIW